MSDSVVGKKLKDMRRRTGLSIREVAEALDGMPASTYASYEDKYKKPHLPITLAKSLIAVFEPHGVKPEEVLELAGVSADMGTPSAKVAASLPALNLAEMPLNLPILGAAACGEDGLFEFNGQVLGYVRRPPRLLGVPDAYAVYSMGDSMVPWRDPGDISYVNPHQPPKIGDYVVVQLQPTNDGVEKAAYIKQLIGRTGSQVTLAQFNPRKEIIIKAVRLATMHRIIPWAELMAF